MCRVASPKKSEPRTKEAQTSSQLVEANLNDDNISVYYSKAINRYENQKQREVYKPSPAQTENIITEVGIKFVIWSRRN